MNRLRHCGQSAVTNKRAARIFVYTQEGHGWTLGIVGKMFDCCNGLTSDVLWSFEPWPLAKSIHPIEELEQYAQKFGLAIDARDYKF